MERAVGKKNDVGTSPNWVVEEPEEVDAILRELCPKAVSSIFWSFQTSGLKCLEVTRPLFSE